MLSCQLNMRQRNRQSIRLKNYDYSQAGAYFVTLCSYQKECLFGKVNGQNVILTGVGKIIHEEWYKSANIRQEITLDTFVIMPNHIHGIVFINNSESTSIANVGARGPSPLQGGKPVAGTGKKPLGSFVGGFKSACTKRVNELRRTPSVPLWQRNYYEHVIRSENALFQIRRYIQENPKCWLEDDENPNKVNP